MAFEKYAQLIVTIPFKIVAVVWTLILIAVAIYAVLVTYSRITVLAVTICGLLLLVMSKLILAAVWLTTEE